jgi:hypothetical protein
MKFLLKINVFTLLNFIFVLIITKYELISAAMADWSDDQAPEKWNKLAKKTIDDLLEREIKTGVAKNLIMFRK